MTRFLAEIRVRLGGTRLAVPIGMNHTRTYLGALVGVLGAIHGCGGTNDDEVVDSTRDELGASAAYEAHASQNTWTGKASIQTCASCSGSAAIGWVGTGPEGTGTLKVNQVSASVTGTYDLAIAYVNGDAADRVAGLA